MKHTFLLTFAAVTALLPAQDDRDRQTPTATFWSPGMTAAEVTTLINDGWRLTDIEIETTSPWSFTVAAVPNSGAYAKAWWYVYGVTQAQLSSSLTTNNARLIDVETYDDGGTIRYAAIMISNTGADAKAWWWYTNQTTAQVVTNVNNNNGRLVCLDRYTTGGNDRFTTVMISNTGADARSWGYLFGASAAAIASNLSSNGGRVYGLDRVGTDSYDTIVIDNPSLGWWYYFNQTSAQVTELLQQNIGRIADIERHSTLLGTRYNVVMLDNANTLEKTVRQEFFAALPGALGDYGFYLKEINGPVLAEMRPDTVFEPASTMKTLYHVHALKRVANGTVALTQLINKPTACGVPGSNQTLSTLLRTMMENSDNFSTLAVGNYFGLTNIENTAGVLGMPSTSINFTIGCEGPNNENTMTLRDLAELHEDVANGYLGAQRNNFYDLMANGQPDGLNFPSWGTQTLSSRINGKALALGMPNAIRDAFKDELLVAYKPGGIAWNTGTQHYYFAEGGFMRVPFKNASGVITPREYTLGVFNYDFAVQEVSGRTVMGDAELELVWNCVSAAMDTWDNYTAGALTTLLGAGCAGSNGTPSHTATGTPEIGQAVTYRLANAPSFAVCGAMFGFDNVSWNGAPLPVNLAPIGAPGCLLRIDAVITDAAFTSLTGTSQVTLPFANDPALIGRQLFTQYLVVDPAANALGITFSNAVRTTIGGWL
ncbi:MAG: serine hydrolase [Planctomycetota bacterium]|jgi:beta-lactamase class A